MSQRPCVCCGLLQKYPSVGLRLLRARSWLEVPNPPLSSPTARREGAPPPAAVPPPLVSTRRPLWPRGSAFPTATPRCGEALSSAPTGTGQLRGKAHRRARPPPRRQPPGPAAAHRPPSASDVEEIAAAAARGRREAATPGRDPTFCGPPPPRGGRRPVTELPTPQTALGGGWGKGRGHN